MVDLVEQVYILGDNNYYYVINFQVCKGNEQVCHVRRYSKLDFFFCVCLFLYQLVRVYFVRRLPGGDNTEIEHCSYPTLSKCLCNHSGFQNSI